MLFRYSWRSGCGWKRGSSCVILLKEVSLVLVLGSSAQRMRLSLFWYQCHFLLGSGRQEHCRSHWLMRWVEADLWEYSNYFVTSARLIRYQGWPHTLTELARNQPFIHLATSLASPSAGWTVCWSQVQTSFSRCQEDRRLGRRTNQLIWSIILCKNLHWISPYRGQRRCCSLQNCLQKSRTRRKSLSSDSTSLSPGTI